MAASGDKRVRRYFGMEIGLRSCRAVRNLVQVSIYAPLAPEIPRFRPYGILTQFSRSQSFGNERFKPRRGALHSQPIQTLCDNKLTQGPSL